MAPFHIFRPKSTDTCERYLFFRFLGSPLSPCDFTYSKTTLREFLLKIDKLVDGWIESEQKAKKSNKIFGQVGGRNIKELFNSYSSDIWTCYSISYYDVTRRQLVIDENYNFSINILPVSFDELFFKVPRQKYF